LPIWLGVGSELSHAVSSSARADGRETLYFVARHDDADSLAYLAKRGFAEVLRMQELSLDVAQASETHARPDGIELVRLEPELESSVYEAALEISPDVPEEGGLWVGNFESWR